jgi:hypothetical protein
MREDVFYNKLLDEELNAMELTLDQRRELMDRIMEEAWNVAREATPDCDNIYADTDEADAIREKQFQIVIEKMLELKKRYGFPIAKYDRTTKRAYIEYADGSREYFD